MRLTTKCNNGDTLNIVVRHDEKERLTARNFRGVDQRFACNISRFARIEEMFHEKVVLDVIRNRVSEKARYLVSRGSPLSDHFSFTIDCGTPIGWESTDILERYSDDALEWFKPNRHSTALRVKLERTDLCAPLTRLISVGVHLRPDRLRTSFSWGAIVFSVRPGEDYGALKGNVTHREGRVFFDQNHPGK